MSFDSFVFLLAEEGGFGINTDILETNLINQLILITGLVFFGRSSLGDALEERQLEIVNNVQDSEKRLAEATSRLEEAKKQLTQARVLMNEIKNEASLVQTKLLETDYEQTKAEILRKLNVATTTLRNRERNILAEVKQQISLLAIEKVVTQIQAQAGTETEQVDYMNARIQMLRNVN